MEDLRAALEQLEAIAGDLGAGEAIAVDRQSAIDP